jgi:enamine deaminase RidA (YjgF/YER057c/UK114 family)
MNKHTDPRSVELKVIHPDPSQAHKMPYAPAVHVVGACDLMFISGATASKLYHDHPHRDDEHIHPHSIEDQTRNAMEAIKSILDEVGASWRDVVKITKYLTDIRDGDGMHKTMREYFGDWRPASTMVCINQLSSPGARVELDMIVALPRAAKG